MIRMMVVLGLMGSGTASASAVAGCRYVGEVASIVRDGRDVTIELRVRTSEAFGHSGPTALCVAPGDAVTLVTRWKEVRGFDLAGGETVDAEVVDTYNPPRHVHVERIVGLHATAAEAPPPAVEPVTPNP